MFCRYVNSRFLFRIPEPIYSDSDKHPGSGSREIKSGPTALLSNALSSLYVSVQNNTFTVLNSAVHLGTFSDIFVNFGVS